MYAVSEDTVVENVLDGYSDSNGHFCRYFQLSDDVGIKYCNLDNHSQEYDDFLGQFHTTYECSKLLYSLGVGPYVWGYKKVNDRVALFYTEHAPEINDVNYDNIEDIIEIFITVFMAGYCIEDIHTGNIGLLNGKPVIIDGGCIGYGFYLGNIEYPTREKRDLYNKTNLFYYLELFLDEYLNNDYAVDIYMSEVRNSFES